MADIPAKSLTQAVVELLTEAYAGPPNPSSTWFIDNEPDLGILGILKQVSAEEASRPVDGEGKPGSTIAANAEHLRWSLARANAYLRGELPQGGWQESWQLIHADPAYWDKLRADLRSEYETLRAAIFRQDDLQDEYLLGVLALIPHAAYHLGTIRQMIERVRQPD